jgi:hypothetical protein
MQDPRFSIAKERKKERKNPEERKQTQCQVHPDIENQ